MPRFSLTPRSVPFRSAVLTCLAFAFQAFAQSPHVGQYIGQIKISLSGAITQPPTSAGAAIFNVSGDGTVAEVSGDPVGAVDAAGTITWGSPNRFQFTSGTIGDGTLSATSSTTANGLTTTLQITAPLVGGAFPAGQTFTRQLVDLDPDNGYIEHNLVHFTGTSFIAVGDFGAIALSDDGKTWRRSAAPTARSLNCAAFGNGTYVVGGNNGVLFTSTDAVNWTPRNSPFGGTANIAGAAYGAGKFLIASSANALATSTDGITWTTQIAPSFGGNVLRFLNGKFVMLGLGVRFSDDGITWGDFADTLVGATDITFGGGQWLCGGSGGLAKSPDGVTWTTTYSGNVKTVAFGNGRYVARLVGSAGAWLQSADATTWRTTNGPIVGTDSFAFGNGRFVGVGTRLAGSGDGIAWELLRKTSLAPNLVDFIPSSTSSPTLIPAKLRVTDIPGQKRVIDVLSWGENSPTTIYTGLNGMVYVQQTNFSRLVDMQTDADLYDHCTSSSVPYTTYIAGEGGVIRRLVMSGNFNSEVFTPTAITSPTANTLRSATDSGGSVRLFVGDNGTIVRINNPNGVSPTAVLETSGTSQHLRYVNFVTTRNNTQLPGRDIAVGNNGTLLVRNGTTGAWTPRTTNTTDNLIGITYVSPTNNNNTNGVYVAVGENGAVITSPDLTTWTAAGSVKASGKLKLFKGHGVSRGVVVGEFGFYAEVFATAEGVYFVSGQNSLTLGFSNSNLRAIAQGGGRFVAVGEKYAATSLTGRDWQASANDATANAIAYGFGRFVSVGGTGDLTNQSNRIQQSTDGGTWTTPTQPAINRPLHSIILAGGRFIASGTDGIVVSSSNGNDWSILASGLATGNTISSLAHNNGVFVGVGGGSVISSTDGGNTWAARNSGGASLLASVAYGNGLFVAVGGDGYTTRSSNGTSFTATRLATFQSSTGSRPVFNTIIFANGKFIAFTASGQAYTTTDGVTWVESFTGINATFTGSTIANGLAVLIGSGKIIGLAVEDTSPYITENPASASVSQGTTLNLSAIASGSGTLEFQWSHNGVPLSNGGKISGANTANLTITGIQPSNAGEYRLLVSNPGGSRISGTATIEVTPAVNVGFAAWVETFVFPENEDGPLDDPDDDDISNLLEFLFGTHPIQANGSSLLIQTGKLTGDQIGAPAASGKTYLTFQARVRKDRPGVTLTPQAGVSLDDFSASVAAQVGLPVDDPGDPEFEIISYYHTLAIEDNSAIRAFMRLAASQAP